MINVEPPRTCGDGFTVVSGECNCAVGKVVFEGACTICPDGTICNAPNLAIESVSINSGYWRTSNSSIEVLKCSNKKACGCEDDKKEEKLRVRRE